MQQTTSPCLRRPRTRNEEREDREPRTLRERLWASASVDRRRASLLSRLASSASLSAASDLAGQARVEHALLLEREGTAAWRFSKRPRTQRKNGRRRPIRRPHACTPRLSPRRPSPRSPAPSADKASTWRGPRRARIGKAMPPCPQKTRFSHPLSLQPAPTLQSQKHTSPFHSFDVLLRRRLLLLAGGGHDVPQVRRPVLQHGKRMRKGERERERTRRHSLNPLHVLIMHSSFSLFQVRASLKEPLRTKARTREAIYYRTAQWAEGAPRQAEVVDLVDPEVEAASKNNKK